MAAVYNYLHNVLIDKIDRTTIIISTSDDIYYKEIFSTVIPNTKGESILQQLSGEQDALQLVLEFPKNE